MQCPSREIPWYSSSSTSQGRRRFRSIPSSCRIDLKADDAIFTMALHDAHSSLVNVSHWHSGDVQQHSLECPLREVEPDVTSSGGPSPLMTQSGQCAPNRRTMSFDADRLSEKDRLSDAGMEEAMPNRKSMRTCPRASSATDGVDPRS